MRRHSRSSTWPGFLVVMVSLFAWGYVIPYWVESLWLALVLVVAGSMLIIWLGSSYMWRRDLPFYANDGDAE